MTQSAQPQNPAQAKTDTMEGLPTLYLQVLRELYSGENQIVQALTVLAASATSPELQQAFLMHQKQSQTQSQRLEQIFQSLGENPNGMISKGIYALLGEGQMLIKMKSPGALLDAGLIAAAQHVEHYEISAYGTARAWANLLGRKQDMQLLEQSLEEETETDLKLTKLAESVINSKAAAF